MENRKKSRKKKWVIALSVLVIIIVSVVVFAVSDFRSASFDATVRTGFSEIIGKRLLVDGAKDGVISVPIDPEIWGGGTNAELFADSINQLPPDDYRYVVYQDGDHQKFIVFSAEPKLISFGFVPKKLLTD